MIPKRFEDIDKSDIELLITTEVSESRTLDYKQNLLTSSSDEKKEFLTDIASFANAAGGDLLFGIEEKRDENGQSTGLPERAVGLSNFNADSGMLRLENMIRDTIEPRILGIQMKSIEGFPNGPVLLIRIPQSWNSPHLVRVGKGTYRFFSRNSFGKYPLDSTEIRAAFDETGSVAEQIRRFRDERLSRIIAGETAVKLKLNPLIVLHFIPIVGISKAFVLDMPTVFKSCRNRLYLLDAGFGRYRYNLDGLLVSECYEGDSEGCNAYLQLFRNGAIETVTANMLNRDGGFGMVVPSELLEGQILQAIHSYSDACSEIDVQPPFIVLLSLLGVRGFKVAGPNHYRRSLIPRETPIDRNNLLLPDVVIENYTADIHAVARVMKPTFDALWQASGWERDFYYDENGEWRPPS